MNPLRGWTVDREQITFAGHDLQRPECVLAEPDGTLWSADARGGVMRIDPDETQRLVAQTVVRLIALTPEGEVLILLDDGNPRGGGGVRRGVLRRHHDAGGARWWTR